MGEVLARQEGGEEVVEVVLGLELVFFGSSSKVSDGGSFILGESFPLRSLFG